MAEMSKKAKKAAITKAQRQLLQEQADKKLIESTQGQSALFIIKDLGTYQVLQVHGPQKQRHWK
jgi:hypothetical protein